MRFLVHTLDLPNGNGRQMLKSHDAQTKKSGSWSRKTPTLSRPAFFVECRAVFG